MNKNNCILIWIFAAMLFSAQKVNAQVNYSLNTVSGRMLSSAIGRGNTSNGTCSFAGGETSLANGSYSFAFGAVSEANEDYSMAIGSFTSVTAQKSIVLGVGANNHDLLINGLPNSIAMGMNSNIPTLLITDSNGENKIGKVSIGNCTIPQAKFHVKGDSDEAADIMLEPGQNYDASVYFRDKDSYIKVAKSGKMTVNVSDKPIIFNASKCCLNSEDTFLKNQDDVELLISSPRKMVLQSGLVQMQANNAINMSALSITNQALDSLTLIGVKAINAYGENINMDADYINLTGKVGINIENYQDDYSLAVNGGIITDRVLIKSIDEWYDAVFANSYRLMPLNELKDFVADHHHLPEVPTESEVMEEGYDMGEMQGLLLKKIEELTLYTLKQQEIIENLQNRIEELERK